MIMIICIKNINKMHLLIASRSRSLKRVFFSFVPILHRLSEIKLFRLPQSLKESKDFIFSLILLFPRIPHFVIPFSKNYLLIIFFLR